MAEPRDIALAIRVRHSDETGTGRSEDAWEEVEEMFDEVGMEAIDESALVEEDDERRK